MLFSDEFVRNSEICSVCQTCMIWRALPLKYEHALRLCPVMVTLSNCEVVQVKVVL